ncbi:MAG: hypothetical protein IPN43_03855 [Chitinophagaceae bacterium]|nr:hypothetical protein [Chitinophagaceae bacterium]
MKKLIVLFDSLPYFTFAQTPVNDVPCVAISIPVVSSGNCTPSAIYQWSNALSTNYNFGTATTSYTAGNDYFNINITKSGLYHFHLNKTQTSGNDYSVTSTTPRTTEVNYNFGPFTGGDGFAPFLKTIFKYSYASYDKSFDVYITAPAFIQFYSLKQAVNITYRINVNGHLITE